jgi:hypothetical protein
MTVFHLDEIYDQPPTHRHPLFGPDRLVVVDQFFTPVKYPINRQHTRNRQATEPCPE